MKYYNNKARQAGMTLIELTVVLLILIGLAGMLIPYVSGFVAKTHQATSGQTINALNSAIERHEVQFFGQPDRMDSLITTGGGNTQVTLPDGATQYAPIAYATGTNDNFIASLTSSGINNVLDQPAVSSTTNVTFDIGTPRATNVDGVVLGFTAQGILNVEAALGRPSNENLIYVAFGIGQNSALAGRTLLEAPTHFHENNHNYAATYGRFLAVYGVPALAGGPGSTAANVLDANLTGEEVKFLGVVGPMSPIEGAAGHIQEYREDSFGS